MARRAKRDLRRFDPATRSGALIALLDHRLARVLRDTISVDAWRILQESSRAVSNFKTVPADPVSGAQASFSALHGLYWLTVNLADAQRLLVTVDDAHWADRSSRDLLTFLIGNQRAIGRRLIVVTFRSDELHRTHPLRPILAA